MIREAFMIFSLDLSSASTQHDFDAAVYAAEELAKQHPDKDAVAVRIISVSRADGDEVVTDKGLVHGTLGRQYTLWTDAPGLPGTSGMPVTLVGYPNDPRYVNVRFGVPVALSGRPITEAKRDWTVPAAVLDLVSIKPERREV